MNSTIWLALALVLVLEGLGPMLYPKAWKAPVQLLGRYWLITNGNGRETEVQGEGVVGVQPLIAPGEEYQYTSGAIIETPLGTMQGSVSLSAL